MRILAGALMIGAALAASAAPVRKPVPVSPAHSRDWSTVATRMPDGAFLLGNPEAKVRLTEYLSLTCPHCAHFEGEGIAPLTAKYVKPGLVAYEVRHALRDAFDFTASALARCNGPEAFFATAPDYFAKQDQWIQQGAKWARATPPAEGLPPEKLLPLIGQGAGLTAFAAAHGVPAAKANACLADKPELDVLVAMASEAWSKPNFKGTPGFYINGASTGPIADWATLDKQLAQAVKQ